MRPANASGLLSACVPPHNAELLFGLDWSDITPMLAAFIAAAVAVYGYSRQQRAVRRDQRAAGYAEALRAVEDYLEAPYLVRRRDGTAEARRAITDHISATQSRIKLHESWLAIHAPAAVHTAYCDFVAAARSDAGPQMTAAWGAPATRQDGDVPMGTAYSQPAADSARERIRRAMRRDVTLRPRREGEGTV